MSIDHSKLGANIRNYIDLNKGLNVKGVGRLKYDYVATKLNSKGNFLEPGSKKLKFEEDLISKGDENEPDFVKKFEANLNFDLETKGFFQESGLGQFRKKDGRIKFLEDRASIDSKSFGLPALTITPLVVEKTSEVKDKNTSSKVIHKNSGYKSNVNRSKSDRNFLLGTAAAAAIFLLLIFTYHSYSAENSYNGEISEVMHDIDQSRLNHSPESMLTSEPINPEFIPGVQKEKEVATCALIVGSFSRKYNAIEMQQKIIAAGYELYTEEFHNFYRVGVALDCSEIHGASFLEVEQSIGTDPWLRISY